MKIRGDKAFFGLKSLCKNVGKPILWFRFVNSYGAIYLRCGQRALRDVFDIAIMPK
jgi:hypothetical protein